MFQITLTFGPTGTQWALLFQTEEKAVASWQHASLGSSEFLTLEDDFGQTVNIVRKSLYGSMFESLEKSQLAHIEIALHRARLQAKAQQMASADPGLRTLARGPAVMTPFEAGNRFNGR
jgi:hypothetical protein